MMAAKAETKGFDIKFDMQRVVLRIQGNSPLMTHAWSTKAVRQMEDSQQQKVKDGKRPPKDPDAEFEGAIYRMPDGSCGIPARSFKKAVVGAATQVDGLHKTFLRGAFHVIGEAVAPVNGPEGELRPTDLIRIQGDDPIMRTDMVRLSGIGRQPDVRYRPEWGSWFCDVPVLFNAKSISVEQLVTLFALAGFAVGVGEWRPERDGMHGMFQVTEVNP
jgi:hypothetical protein